MDDSFDYMGQEMDEGNVCVAQRPYRMFRLLCGEGGNGRADGAHWVLLFR